MKARTMMALALATVLAAGIHRAPASGAPARGATAPQVEELVGAGGFWDMFACSACLAGFGADMLPWYGNFVSAVARLGDGFLPNKCIEVCFMTL